MDIYQWMVLLIDPTVPKLLKYSTQSVGEVRIMLVPFYTLPIVVGIVEKTHFCHHLVEQALKEIKPLLE